MLLRSRPRTDRASEPDTYADDRHPGRTHDVTVFDPGPVWRPSGILDASGDMIERYAGLNRVGFLWDQFDEDA
jgi:hypothetical protein